MSYHPNQQQQAMQIQHSVLYQLSNPGVFRNAVNPQQLNRFPNPTMPAIPHHHHHHYDHSYIPSVSSLPLHIPAIPMVHLPVPLTTNYPQHITNNIGINGNQLNVSSVSPSPFADPPNNQPHKPSPPHLIHSSPPIMSNLPPLPPVTPPSPISDVAFSESAETMITFKSPSLSPPEWLINGGRDCLQRLDHHQSVFPHRARLNIFIARNFTAFWHDKVMPSFESDEKFYYYLDMSTAIQMNDKQLIEYQGKDGKVMFINYDIYNQHGEQLFAVIKPNDRQQPKVSNKWLWKLEWFMTAAEIYNYFGVGVDWLPKSSRAWFDMQIPRSYNLCQVTKYWLTYDVVESIDDWNDIKQITNKKKDDEEEGVKNQSTLSLNKWLKKCRNGWNKYEAIPILVNENRNNQNKHWVELVKIIPYQTDNISIGISFRFDINDWKWKVTAICMDDQDLINKSRLLGVVQNNVPCISMFNEMHIMPNK